MIGIKLKKILKEKKMTQKEFGELLGVTQGQINSWITNRRVPSQSSLTRIAHALEVTVSYFLEDIDISNPQIITDLVKIPIIGEIPAGQPIEAIETYIDAVYVPREIINGKKVFGLSVKGDSMYPTILDGDYVLVCPDLEIDNNNVVAVRFDHENQVTLKRYRKNNEAVMLIPDNKDYDPIILNDEYIIIGKVIYMVRKNI